MKSDNKPNQQQPGMGKPGHTQGTPGTNPKQPQQQGNKGQGGFGSTGHDKGSSWEQK